MKLPVMSLKVLSEIQLSPVLNGAITGPPIQAGTLWFKEPTAIYVVRRPGCALCREDAREISSRFASGEFSGTRLVGIIKEVAPIKGVETDAELGVGEFQSKYFNGNPLYMDKERSFYSYLGNKSLFAQPLHTWNPFTLYHDYIALKDRLKAKDVDGNLKGEGFLKGGFLIVTPTEGVIYQREETTGTVMPMEEIRAALQSITPQADPTTFSHPADKGGDRVCDIHTGTCS